MVFQHFRPGRLAQASRASRAGPARPRQPGRAGRAALQAELAGPAGQAELGWAVGGGGVRGTEWTIRPTVSATKKRKKCRQRKQTVKNIVKRNELTNVFMFLDVSYCLRLQNLMGGRSGLGRDPHIPTKGFHSRKA